MELFDFLPGQLRLQRGQPADYHVLSRFHYCAHRPATFAGVWTVRHLLHDPTGPPIQRIVAVATLSWPTLRCAPRERLLGLQSMSAPRRATWVNRHLRLISRVIVHPQFRGIGLASALVRQILRDTDIPWIEALAHMGRAHPFFQRAGMRPFHRDDAPTYYLWRRPTARAADPSTEVLP